MFIQSNVARAGRGQDRAHSAHSEEGLKVQPRPITIPIYPILAVVVGLTIGIIVVIAVARTRTAPAITEPPQRFLPGSVLPADAYCSDSANARCYPPTATHCNESGDRRCFTYPSYYIQQIDKEIYLTVEIESGTIIQTVIPAHEYTMGDLMVAWGVPTGFSQNGPDINVYWNMRGAHLTTCSFRIESHLDWLTYYAEPTQVSPWRGFNNRKRENC